MKILRLVNLFFIIVLMLTSVGCQTVAPQVLSFSRDIYPLVMGQVENTIIYFNETQGIVFFTKNLPYLQRPFSLFIPFSQLISGKVVTPEAITYIQGEGMSWEKLGFSVVDGTNRVVQIIRNFIKPDMTWKDFTSYLWTVQAEQFLTKLSLYSGASGGSALINTTLFTMPVIFIVPVGVDGGKPDWWYLDTLFPEVEMN